MQCVVRCVKFLLNMSIPCLLCNGRERNLMVVPTVLGLKAAVVEAELELRGEWEKDGKLPLTS